MTSHSTDPSASPPHTTPRTVRALRPATSSGLLAAKARPTKSQPGNGRIPQSNGNSWSRFGKHDIL